MPASEIARLLETVHRQVAVALWLSGGMLLALAMIVLSAAGWRRAGLAAGLLYSASLCFVPVGRAHAVGALGIAAALAGLLRRSS